MFRNCLAAALRHIGRNKLYTAISVFGLAVGLWAALLAALLLHNQFSFDHFIPGYDRIYMAMSWVTPPGHATIYMSSTNSFVGPELKLAFSEIDAVTRLSQMRRRCATAASRPRRRSICADPNAFEVLPLPTVAGNLKSALQRPDSIVLSRSMARKYFGRDAPLGRTLMLDGIHPMTVRAVIEDLPVNGTHLQGGTFGPVTGTQPQGGIFASGLAAWSELGRQDRIPGNVKGRDMSIGIKTYLRLAPGASARSSCSPPCRLWRAPCGRTHHREQAWPLGLLRMDRLNSHPGLNPVFAARAVMTLVLGRSSSSLPA